MDDPDLLQRLAAAAAEGDDRALTGLVRRTEPAVRRLCGSLGSPETVDDLVQETYARAVRALPGFRGEAPVQAWLLSIARRACADDVRRRQRRRRLDERLRASVVDEPVADHVPVHDLLDDLDDDRREAFVLTQLLGYRYEEAATIVGCPVGTIRSRVARARRDLVSRLAQADAS